MFFRLMIANFKEMTRDRMRIFWFLVFPVIFVLVFGLLFPNDGPAPAAGAGVDADRGDTGAKAVNIIYEIGIAAKGDTPLSALVQAHFKEVFKLTGMFKLHSGGKTVETKAFEEGNRHALLLLPGDFVENLQYGKPVSMDLYYDETHPEVLFAVSRLVKAVENTIIGKPELVTWNFTTSLQFHQDAAAPFNRLDAFLPGLLALTLMQLGLFGSMRLLNLKEQNTLKTLGTTPMPRSVFLAAEITFRLVWALIQGLIIVVLSHFVFNLTFTGQWLAVIGWILLGTASFIAMGYMFTTFVKTSESCGSMMQVVQFPMMFLSGIFIPAAMMPEFIRPVVSFMPLTYMADSLKHAITGLPSMYGNVMNLLILAGILSLCLLVTVLRFKWE
jgi:ABC-2 type transport system permease protein